jgi:hypothetical protein
VHVVESLLAATDGAAPRGTFRFVAAGYGGTFSLCRQHSVINELLVKALESQR